MPENTSNGVAIGSLERAEGELQGIDRARAASEVRPDRELVERPRRRRFSAQYKLEILREADACTRPGEIGELLRREGLYSSLLTEWRRARDSGALQALERPRGRRKADPRDAENEVVPFAVELRGGDRVISERLRA